METPTSQEPLAAAAAQELLRDIDTVIFDCDGVLWTGSNVVPGAARCIAALHAAGKRTLFMTNNSSSSRQDLLGKFEKMGLAGVTREMIYNSGYVSALYMKQRPLPKETPKIFCVGGDGLCDELRGMGLEVEGGAAHAREWGNASMEAMQDELLRLRENDEGIGAVISGFNTYFNYFTISRATIALLRPTTRFITTNDDRLTPQRGGLMVPAGGAMMASLSYASSRDPIIIGKPSQYALDAILADSPEMRRGSTLMVGDRLDTDVAFGKAGGLRTLLVLSGCTTAAEAEAAAAGGRPDAVASSVAVLAEALEDS